MKKNKQEERRRRQRRGRRRRTRKGGGEEDKNKITGINPFTTLLDFHVHQSGLSDVP